MAQVTGCSISSGGKLHLFVKKVLSHFGDHTWGRREGWIVNIKNSWLGFWWAKERHLRWLDDHRRILVDSLKSSGFLVQLCFQGMVLYLKLRTFVSPDVKFLS